MLLALVCALAANLSYGFGTVLQATGARRASTAGHLDVMLFAPEPPTSVSGRTRARRPRLRRIDHRVAHAATVRRPSRDRRQRRRHRDDRRVRVRFSPPPVRRLRDRRPDRRARPARRVGARPARRTPVASRRMVAAHRRLRRRERRDHRSSSPRPSWRDRPRRVRRSRFHRYRRRGACAARSPRRVGAWPSSPSRSRSSSMAFAGC